MISVDVTMSITVPTGNLVRKEAATPQEAEQMVQGYLKSSYDGIKFFTGS